jgi:UDP-glucose 4-epimerase
MKLLITGSTGFLGGRLASFLSKEPNIEMLLGSRATLCQENTPLRTTLVKTEWHDPLALNAICENVDTIVHLAGMNAGQCVNASSDELATDVKATENLLRAAVHNNVKRIIYLSTAHVYSSTLLGSVSEETPTTNTHPYAINHLAKEKLVLQAHQSGRIEGVVIRLSNAFGVPESQKANCWMLLVNDLCKQVATSNKLILKSTGQQRRDFVAITDFCLAIKHLINLPSNKLGDGLYNLGGHWAPTILEITQYIGQRYHCLTGIRPEITHEPLINDLNSPEFHFSIQKLLDTGYNPAPKSKVEREIGNLLSFCLNTQNSSTDNRLKI